VIAAVLVNTSNLEEHAGNETLAVSNAQQAVAEARKLAEPVMLNQALSALAEHQAEAGHFDDAFKMFDEIEQLQQKANDKAGLASTHAERVTLLADADRDKEADALAVATLATLDAKSDPDNYGWLKLELARLELDRKHYDLAQTLLDAASGVVINAGDVELGAEVQITGAQVVAARGDLARAQAQLVAVRKGAIGRDGIVREVDIVAAALAWNYGHDRDARARLLEIARVARAHGAGAQARMAERDAR
jgi:tetratricopeptide (TPR) repeat protein